jgi:hypothetical protein
MSAANSSLLSTHPLTPPNICPKARGCAFNAAMSRKSRKQTGVITNRAVTTRQAAITVAADGAFRRLRKQDQGALPPGPPQKGAPF